MNESYTLITGASSGFGRSIAQKLAPTRRIILAGRNMEKLEAARSTCAMPERHMVWARDLSRLEGLGDELAAFMAEKQICIDHFVHSAGFTGIQFARAVEMTFVTRVFNVNVFSAMEIIRPLTQNR